MKRFISLLLTAFMLLILIPFSAFDISVSAETSTDSQGITYSLSDSGTYYIVTEFDRSVTEVIIPVDYFGLPIRLCPL